VRIAGRDGDHDHRRGGGNDVDHLDHVPDRYDWYDVPVYNVDKGGDNDHPGQHDDDH
jgi:hypothetical protein